MPEPFDVSLDGEVTYLDKKDPKIEKILQKLEDMDEDGIDIVAGVVDSLGDKFPREK